MRIHTSGDPLVRRKEQMRTATLIPATHPSLVDVTWPMRGPHICSRGVTHAVRAATCACNMQTRLGAPLMTVGMSQMHADRCRPFSRTLIDATGTPEPPCAGLRASGRRHLNRLRSHYRRARAHLSRRRHALGRARIGTEATSGVRARSQKCPRGRTQR